MFKQNKLKNKTTILVFPFLKLGLEQIYFHMWICRKTNGKNNKNIEALVCHSLLGFCKKSLLSIVISLVPVVIYDNNSASFKVDLAGAVSTLESQQYLEIHPHTHRDITLFFVFIWLPCAFSFSPGKWKFLHIHHIQIIQRFHVFSNCQFSSKTLSQFEVQSLV